MRELLRKLGWLCRRPSREAELEEELRFHLEEEAAALRETGLPDRAARFTAHRGLGNVALVQEETRAAWGWTWFEQLAQDVRYALRTMRANKTFTALAALSLALGIGANTAIYSFIDAILLRSLPVRDPASLVLPVWCARDTGRNSVIHGLSGSFDDEPGSGRTVGNIFPYPAYEALARHGSVFSSLFGYYQPDRLNVAIHGQSESLAGIYVMGDYFGGLGILPSAGRLLTPDDDRAGATSVVLAFGMAQRHFGGAAEAVGQTMIVNNAPMRVVGVAPRQFSGTDPAAAPDLYIPLHAGIALEAVKPFGLKAKWLADPNLYWLRVMGRLRHGATMTQAQAVLAPVFHDCAASSAETDQERATLPWLEMRAGGGGLTTLRQQYSEPLFVLLTMVALILAIACANIANLMLSRAAARAREMAMRLSVGAGSKRLIRQLLTESILLSLLGGALGVILALWGIRSLTLLLANGEDEFTLHAGLNWHVLAIAVALSAVTGILFGLAPALQATRVDVLSALKSGRAGQPRPRYHFGLNHVLVIAQIALSLVMLAGAGLFTRTLAKLEGVDLGFNREKVLIFNLNAAPAGHKDPEIVSFYGDLRRRFSAVPGVRDASLSMQSLVGEGHSGFTAHVEGKQSKPVAFLTVGPHFFSTMQIPLLAGRALDERDRAGAPIAAVVNEHFAREYYGSANPLGRRFAFANTRDIEIVGICANTLYGDLRHATEPMIFLSYSQGAWPVAEMTYALRTAGDPMSYANAVRQIVHDADQRLPVTGLRTQAAAIDRSINQEIVFARLCSGFAILALAIACVGLYGTVSYHVARRSGEIGIRMALGAQRRSVVWMVLRSVLVVAAVGIAISIPVAAEAAKLVKSFLFGIAPHDPLALAGAAAILLASAMLAAYAPARRASRIDPMKTLREE